MNKALVILGILYIPTFISIFIFTLLKDKKELFLIGQDEVVITGIMLLLIPILDLIILIFLIYVIISNKLKLYYPKICSLRLHDWEYIENKDVYVCLKCYKIKETRVNRKFNDQIIRQKIALNILNSKYDINEQLIAEGIKDYDEMKRF